MKKRFNLEKGSLYEKFKQEEAIPSLKLWRNLEQQLTMLNAQRRKEKKQKIVLWSAYAATMIIVIGATWTLSLKLNSDVFYNPRNISFQSRPNSVSVERTESNTWHNNLYKTIKTNVIQHSPQLLWKYNINYKKVNSSTPLAETKLPKQYLTLNKIKLVVKPIKQSLGMPLHMRTFSGYTMASNDILKGKPNKWQINWSGGIDNTTAESNAIKNTPSMNNIVNNQGSLSLGSFIHNKPVAFNLGAERSIRGRVSAKMGFDYRHMEANTNPIEFKNTITTRTGVISHIGLTLGLAYHILNTKNIVLEVGGDLNFAHAGNAMITTKEFTDNQLSDITTEEQATGSAVFNNIIYLGMKLKLSPHWLIGGALHFTKPIHGYSNHFNAYSRDKGFINGARLAVSYRL